MCYVTLAGFATTLPSTMVYIAIVMPWAAVAAAAAAAAAATRSLLASVSLRHWQHLYNDY